MVFRKLIYLLSTLLILSANIPAQAEETKIGFVNFIEAMRNHPRLKAKQKKFEQQFSKREEELKTMIGKIKKLEADYEKNKLVWKEADRDKKQTELRRLRQRYRLEREDLDREQKLFNNEETIDLEKSLYRAVANFAKQEKYDLILDARFMMYGSDKLEITQKIVDHIKNMKK